MSKYYEQSCYDALVDFNVEGIKNAFLDFYPNMEVLFCTPNNRSSSQILVFNLPVFLHTNDYFFLGIKSKDNRIHLSGGICKGYNQQNNTLVEPSYCLNDYLSSYEGSVNQLNKTKIKALFTSYGFIIGLHGNYTNQYMFLDTATDGNLYLNGMTSGSVRSDWLQYTRGYRISYDVNFNLILETAFFQPLGNPSNDGLFNSPDQSMKLNKVTLYNNELNELFTIEEDDSNLAVVFTHFFATTSDEFPVLGLYFKDSGYLTANCACQEKTTWKSRSFFYIDEEGSGITSCSIINNIPVNPSVIQQ